MNTQRLHLRPVEHSDAAALFSIYGDPATNRFNPAGPYPDIDHARTVLDGWLDHWQCQGFGHWAISLWDSPQNIIGFGGISLRRYTDTEINNLGYRFATAAWGKGLATEFAARAVFNGFDNLKLSDISAVVRPNHLASQNVLHKVGFTYFGNIDDVKDAPPSMLFNLSFDTWKKNASSVKYR